MALLGATVAAGGVASAAAAAAKSLLALQPYHRRQGTCRPPPRARISAPPPPRRLKELWLRQDLRLTIDGEDHSLADLLKVGEGPEGPEAGWHLGPCRSCCCKQYSDCSSRYSLQHASPVAPPPQLPLGPSLPLATVPMWGISMPLTPRPGQGHRTLLFGVPDRGSVCSEQQVRAARCAGCLLPPARPLATQCSLTPRSHPRIVVAIPNNLPGARLLAPAGPAAQPGRHARAVRHRGQRGGGGGLGRAPGPARRQRAAGGSRHQPGATRGGARPTGRPGRGGWPRPSPTDTLPGATDPGSRPTTHPQPPCSPTIPCPAASPGRRASPASLAWSSTHWGSRGRTASAMRR